MPYRHIYWRVAIGPQRRHVANEWRDSSGGLNTDRGPESPTFAGSRSYLSAPPSCRPRFLPLDFCFRLEAKRLPVFSQHSRELDPLSKPAQQALEALTVANFNIHTHYLSLLTLFSTHPSLIPTPWIGRTLRAFVSWPGLLMPNLHHPLLRGYRHGVFID